jgi:hypothetical protein
MIMLLAATGLLVADVAASSMIGYGSAWEVSRPFGDAMQVIGTTIDANANWWVSEKVMAERAMLDGALSDTTAIDRAEADFLVMMIPSGIIAAVGATLWSVVLFHRGRRWALAFQVIRSDSASSSADLLCIAKCHRRGATGPITRSPSVKLAGGSSFSSPHGWPLCGAWRSLSPVLC